MRKYQVWIVAYDKVTLNELARAVIYEHDDRLNCEGFNESMTPQSKVLAAIQYFGDAVFLRAPHYAALTLPAAPVVVAEGVVLKFVGGAVATIKNNPGGSLGAGQVGAATPAEQWAPVQMREARGPRIKGIMTSARDSDKPSPDVVRVALDTLPYEREPVHEGPLTKVSTERGQLVVQQLCECIGMRWPMVGGRCGGCGKVRK